MLEINIRPIELSDNKRIAEIVREAMREFDADPKTTILGDPTLDTMYQNYRGERSAYYVVEKENALVGGCGLKQLDGGSPDICELQQMFLLKEVRGIGIGKTLLEKCLADSRRFKFKEMYLETLSQMKTAISLYTSYGFTPVPSPLGNTGHSGCDIRMHLAL